MRALPFDGYSWQISQHEIAFTEETTLALLGAAQQFDGLDNNSYRKELNAFVAGRNILTDNVRDDVASPWRDYQQVLAELGLIVSTRASSVLRVTPIGWAYLAGNLPFKAMLTSQLLRYQYPNGQKGQIAGRDSITACVLAGVLIRPATTLLKVLTELRKAGIDRINVRQIAAYVLPNRLDTEWDQSVSELIKDPNGFAPWDRDVSRNLRAWVRLLGKTTLFSASLDSNYLYLSQTAIADFNGTCTLADELITEQAWMPTLHDEHVRLSWFTYFGSLEGLNSELETAAAEAVGELAYEQPEEEELPNGDNTISLQNFAELNTIVQIGEGLSGADLLASMRKGREKLAFSKSEHDKIVNVIADRYKARGYSLNHDPRSVDLLAISPGGRRKIVEVKTVNPLNFGKQVRHALGQVLEYDYRLSLQGFEDNERIIVVNRRLRADEWRLGFCVQNQIKLVSTTDLSEL